MSGVWKITAPHVADSCVCGAKFDYSGGDAMMAAKQFRFDHTICRVRGSQAVDYEQILDLAQTALENLTRVGEFMGGFATTDSADPDAPIYSLSTVDDCLRKIEEILEGGG